MTSAGATKKYVTFLCNIAFDFVVQNGGESTASGKERAENYGRDEDGEWINNNFLGKSSSLNDESKGTRGETAVCLFAYSISLSIRSTKCKRRY